MRRFVVVLGLAVVLGMVGGCSDTPTQPPVQSTNSSPELQRGSLLNGQLPQLSSLLQVPLQDVQLLSLPASIPPLPIDEFSTEGTVTPASGGTLQLNVKYSTLLIFNTVSISTTFHVPAGAVSQDEQLTMTLNTTTFEYDFGPQGLQFSTPATMDVSASGLDLSTIPSGTTIELFYYDVNNGTYDEIPAGSITYDVSSGTVTCSGAQISHFSEYAFGYVKK